MRCDRCFYIVTVRYNVWKPTHLKLCSGCFLEVSGRLPQAFDVVSARYRTGRGIQDVELFGEWSS